MHTVQTGLVDYAGESLLTRFNLQTGFTNVRRKDIAVINIILYVN